MDIRERKSMNNYFYKYINVYLLFYDSSNYMHCKMSKSYFINTYTLENQRLKITQLEKASFIKVNELELTEVELF